MSKETVKRDKNGRFAKKEECKCGQGYNPDDYIKRLEKERDLYKSLSERLGSDYLNKCAEFGEVRRALRAYETNWPKLRAIAKYHRHQSNKLHDVNVILLDALREAAIEMDWLRDRIPFYKKPFLRKKLHEWDEYFDSLCNKAEGLDRE